MVGGKLAEDADASPLMLAFLPLRNSVPKMDLGPNLDFSGEGGAGTNVTYDDSLEVEGVTPLIPLDPAAELVGLGRNNPELKASNDDGSSGLCRNINIEFL
jgi:hypothetical protein